MSADSSAAVAALAAPGAAESIESLLDRLSGRISAVLFRHGVLDQDCQDVLQRTLVLLVKNYPAIRDPEAWLMNVLRRQCLMYHRRERSKRRIFEDTLDLDELVTGGGQESIDLRLDLERALRGVSPQQRRLLAYRYVVGCSGEEAARRAGYRPETGRKLTARLSRRLSDTLRHDRAGGLRRRVHR